MWPNDLRINSCNLVLTLVRLFLAAFFFFFINLRRQRSLAFGAYFRALPVSGQCSLVKDNTVHQRTVTYKKLLGREHRKSNSWIRTLYHCVRILYANHAAYLTWGGDFSNRTTKGVWNV